MPVTVYQHDVGLCSCMITSSRDDVHVDKAKCQMNIVFSHYIPKVMNYENVIPGNHCINHII